VPTTGSRRSSARSASVDHTSTIGNAGAAEAALQLATYLETAEPGHLVALISLADGADVLIFRVTDAITARPPARSIADQIEAGNSGSALQQVPRLARHVGAEPAESPRARSLVGLGRRSFDRLEVRLRRLEGP
jgi:hypothetical protein